MAISIGINGFGRIGRVALRIALINQTLLRYAESMYEMQTWVI